MKTTLIALLIFASGVVMANGNLKVSIVQGAIDEAVVNISNAVNSVFEIQVNDENGNVIFYKITQHPSTNYSNVYDFSRLDDGLYSFMVNIDNEQSTSTLKVSNGNLNVIEQNKEVDPFFALNNDRLEIAYLNFDQRDIKLYVYESGSNRLLHEEELGKKFVLNHALDLSKLRSGAYDAVLVSNLATHQYDFKID